MPTHHAATVSLKRRIAHFSFSITLHGFVALLLFNLVWTTSRPHATSTLVTDLDEVPQELPFDELVQSGETIVADDPSSLAGAMTPGNRHGLVSSPALSREALRGDDHAFHQLTGGITRPLFGKASKEFMSRGLSGIAGTTANATSSEMAISRLTIEILRKLAENKVLVVWVFDSSPSLSQQREKVAQKFTRIYRELDEIGVPKNMLLTAVVSAGATTQFCLKEPTNELDKLTKAMDQITNDESGEENIFTAVRQAAQAYRHYQVAGKCTLMMILVTDEVGSDLSVADDTLALLKRNSVPLYVLGPMATFGGDKLYDHQVIAGFHFEEPIVRGPFARRDEVLRVAFNSRLYPAGFGPFALVQLTRETGGIYFLFDDQRIAGPRYDPDLLNRYHPNYESPRDYLLEITQSAFRRKLMDVVENGNKIWRRHWPDSWVYADNPQRSLQVRAKETANFLTFANKALPILESIEPLWETETNPRWQANFDLAFARLLRSKVQAEEYAWLLAQAQRQPLILKDPIQHNGWHVKWEEPLHQGEPDGSMGDGRLNPMNKKAQDANKLLEKSQFHYRRVLDLHAGTPWGEAATREHSLPSGAVWAEGFNVWHITEIDRDKYNQARRQVIKQ